MNNLKTIWNGLTSRFAADDELVSKLWTEIENNHTTSTRHYHNLAHLDDMMERANIYKENLIDPDMVKFSIFYHDCVYDPERHDNEERSAATAQQRLSRLGVPGKRITKCRNQILATKGHKNKDDNDTNYLLDFDLAILGDTPENYKNYTKKIRKEYSVYPDDLYKKARKNVLQNFLDRERIFKTAEFYDKYEYPARENLKTEIEKL